MFALFVVYSATSALMSALCGTTHVIVLPSITPWTSDGSAGFLGAEHEKLIVAADKLGSLRPDASAAASNERGDNGQHHHCADYMPHCNPTPAHFIRP
jgi:hypothetical protein